MLSLPEPSNDGNRSIRGRELHKHRLLNRVVAEDFRAIAYPVSESEGLYFWSILLPRLGLTYLCSPRQNEPLTPTGP